MKYAKWQQYSHDTLAKIVSQSQNDKQVAQKIGYSTRDSRYVQLVHNMYEEEHLDTSHFVNDTANLIKWKGSKQMLQELELIRGHKCENCGYSEWQGKPIKLEVHHINGDRLNNDPSNLQLLCPNCHALTENYRKPATKKVISDEDFVKALQTHQNIHQALLSLGLTAKAGNYVRARELIQKYKIEALY